MPDLSAQLEQVMSTLEERLRSGAVALRNYDSPLRTRVTIRATLLREVAADAEAAADRLRDLEEVATAARCHEYHDHSIAIEQRECAPTIRDALSASRVSDEGDALSAEKEGYEHDLVVAAEEHAKTLAELDAQRVRHEADHKSVVDLMDDLTRAREEAGALRKMLADFADEVERNTYGPLRPEFQAGFPNIRRAVADVRTLLSGSTSTETSPAHETAQHHCDGIAHPCSDGSDCRCVCTSCHSAWVARRFPSLAPENAAREGEHGPHDQHGPGNWWPSKCAGCTDEGIPCAPAPENAPQEERP